jgi:hypothetical protein
MSDGTHWTVSDLARYAYENGNQLPPHLQPGAGGTVHHHAGGNTYHITINPLANSAPTAEPKKKPKSRKRRAAEGTGRIALWALKTLFTQQQKQQPQQPQIVYVQHPWSESLGHLLGVICFMFALFFVAVLFIAALSGPHWYPAYYPPPHWYDR